MSVKSKVSRKKNWNGRNPEELPPAMSCIYRNGVDIRTGKPADAKEASSVPKVISVDYHIKSNSAKHNTYDYDLTERQENPHLVVRRGESFNLTVELDKKYDRQKDDLRLIFEIGTMPMLCKGTKKEIILSEEDKQNEWGAKIESQEDKKLTLLICTPPDCIVGKWDFIVSAVKRNSENKKTEFTYKDEKFIYILFNPWCRHDQVYFPDTEYLHEYVMNDLGLIYTGGQLEIYWLFGQFEKDILECALYLLEKHDLQTTCHGDPVKIVRALSAMVNSNDDDGVLVGNWGSNWGKMKEGETKPTSWFSSTAILEKFFKTKEPVKFGQCWVFSGVLTTLCRTLGIPTRSITNYDSAHDMDGNVDIDWFYDKDGNQTFADSIWEYHCWNEAWMARPDLPAGYGGWQAIDSTPQETSEGVFQCGPASVVAIKNGSAYLPHDSKFFISEVNADIKKYLKADGEIKLLKTETNKVGTNIVTSYSGYQQSITEEYKYPEGSPEERAALANAHSAKKPKPQQGSLEDETFKVSLEKAGELVYGKPFEVRFKVQNMDDSTRTIDGYIRVCSISQTGIREDDFKVENFENLEIQKFSDRDIAISVPFKDYEDYIIDQRIINVAIFGNFQELKKYFFVEKNFSLGKIELIMKAPPRVKVGQKFKVDMTFTNPSEKTWTDCYVNYESSKLQKSVRVKQKDVKGTETFKYTIELTAGKVPRKRKILANFCSKAPVEISGSCDVEIVE